jgi:hypothetical protein
MITFEYNAAADTVLSKVVGEITADTVMRTRAELRESPLAGKRAVIDLTETNALFPGVEIENLAQTEPVFGDIALVARPHSGTYATCRIFQAYGHPSRKIGCFDNFAHAQMWLNGTTTLDVSQIDPPCEYYQVVRPIVWYVRDNETGVDILRPGMILEIGSGRAPSADLVECEVEGKAGFVSITDLRTHGRRIGEPRRK